MVVDKRNFPGTFIKNVTLLGFFCSRWLQTCKYPGPCCLYFDVLCWASPPVCNQELHY